MIFALTLLFGMVGVFFDSGGNLDLPDKVVHVESEEYEIVEGRLIFDSVPDSVPLTLTVQNCTDEICTIEEVEVVAKHRDTSKFWILGLALLGGFALNFMPCVLPVVGLKVMSFREGGMFLYALGIMSVFWTLALGAIVFNFAWGQHFGSAVFQMVMIAVIFAMALSFLDYWKLPMPGFSTSSTGKFSLGVLTTVLATPCIAPGMGTALAWSGGRPWFDVWTVFTFMGLGMSVPYVVLGLFPSLLRFVPKPGAWMRTFKELMGFVLLGTVLFFLSFSENVFLMVCLMFGVWFSLFCLKHSKYLAVVAVLALVIAGIFSQTSFEKYESYSPERLEDLTHRDQTVLVHFSADWCVNCKVVQRVILPNLEGHVLIADIDDPEGKELFDSFGGRGIPALAVYKDGDVKFYHDYPRSLE